MSRRRRAGNHGDEEVKLKRSYVTAYTRLLETISEELPRLPPRFEGTAFWPSAGPGFRRDSHFLFVGQATNGWGRRKDGTWIESGRVPSVAAVKAYADSLLDESGNSLGWIEEEGFGQVPFWSTVRSFVSEDDDVWRSGWTCKVAWTNLFKIAPARRGNPSPRLREIQIEHCQAMLRIEIESMKPSAIVFLTGHDWYSDFANHGTIPELPNAAVARGGTYLGRPAVLLPHPRTARRLGLTNAQVWDQARRELLRAGWNEGSWK